MKAIFISHIIGDLGTGGAQTMLYKLVSKMNKHEFDIRVISLTNIGTIGEKIGNLGIPVRALGMKRRSPNPWLIFKLARWVRHDRSDIIQTWMYHADLIGGLGAKMEKKIPVVWNIRHSNLDPNSNKKTTLWTAKLCAKLSGWLPSKIVCCSQASELVHARLGYNHKKILVIPNGFDLNTFSPNINERKAIRKELALGEEIIIVGLIARFDPQKDHHTFFQAASLLHRNRPEVHFVLCGDGINWNNSYLTAWINEFGIESVTHLLGRRNDIPSIQASLDIASSSSSHGEGFSNVIGEAMACGIPCVVTDVGDAAIVVGDTGLVVPPKDPEALANAWERILSFSLEERMALGIKARQRIKENFELSLITERYQQLYREMISLQ